MRIYRLAINPHGDKPAWRLITNQLTTGSVLPDRRPNSHVAIVVLSRWIAPTNPTMAIWLATDAYLFYGATLCYRGICLLVCLSQVNVLLKPLTIVSRKQRYITTVWRS